MDRQHPRAARSSYSSGMAHLELAALLVREYQPAFDFFVRVLDFDLVTDEPALTNDGRPRRWVVVRPKGAASGLLLARADSDTQLALVGRQFAGRVGFFLRVASPLDSLFRVRVDRTPSVVVQAPEFVVALDVDAVVNWDLHPDGTRFVYTAPARSQVTVGGADGVRYFVLQGWFGELRRLTAPTGR